MRTTYIPTFSDRVVLWAGHMWEKAVEGLFDFPCAFLFACFDRLVSLRYWAKSTDLARPPGRFRAAKYCCSGDSLSPFFMSPYDKQPRSLTSRHYPFSHRRRINSKHRPLVEDSKNIFRQQTTPTSPVDMYVCMYDQVSRPTQSRR